MKQPTTTSGAGAAVSITAAMAAIAETKRRALHLAGVKDEAAFDALPKDEKTAFLTQAKAETSGPIRGTGQGVKNFDPRCIRRSPFNREIDRAGLAELIADVKERGVLQAGGVRPVNPPVRGPGGVMITHELIWGERRWLAATAAGVLYPAAVHDVDDIAAIEMQAVENLDREGLNAFDEAVKYQQLMERYQTSGLSAAKAVEKLCDRVQNGSVKLSKSTVYERMRLLKLPDHAKAALRKGVLPSSHAGLIAKLDDNDMQVRATNRILKPEHWERGEDSEIMSFRQAKQLIAQLEQELERRRDYNRQRDEFVKQKLRVLEPAECKKLFAHDNTTSVEDDCGFVGVESMCLRDSDFRTWKKVLGKKAPQQILAQAPNGKAVIVYAEKEAVAALKTTGAKLRDTSSSRSSSGTDAARLGEHKVRVKAFNALLGEVSDRAERMEGPDLLMFFFQRVTQFGGREAVQRVVKRRAIEVQDKYDMAKDLRKAMHGATGKQLRGVIAELLFSHFAPSTWSSGWSDGFVDACKLFGIEAPKWKVQASGKAAK